jgi:hypothetical protein
MRWYEVDVKVKVEGIRTGKGISGAVSKKMIPLRNYISISSFTLHPFIPSSVDPNFQGTLPYPSFIEIELLSRNDADCPTLDAKQGQTLHSDYLPSFPKHLSPMDSYGTFPR